MEGRVKNVKNLCFAAFKIGKIMSMGYMGIDFGVK